jgi:hypothetical protein
MSSKTRYGRKDMRDGEMRKRRKQLLDDLMKNGRYWNLKEEALDRTLWKSRSEIGYGPVAKQTL